MALPTPRLDDRSFQDLVDEAKRLIPQFCPEWTNHNVSDPGVALIEVFAWMTEIFLYRLNQIPDRQYATLLSLVGIEPFGAAPARTDLTFFLSTTDADAVTVPAGTEVRTNPTVGDPIIFRTDRSVTIRQPHLIAMLTEDIESRYRDVWDDLRHESTSVTCFPSEPMEPGEAFYLGFDTSLAGNVLRLEVSAPVLGVGVAPERPPLQWQVWGSETWLPCIVHEDTTGGLNRTGTITLLVPPIHDSLSLGEIPAHWVRCMLLEPEPGQPGYEASPGIQSLGAASLGGTVSGHHGGQVASQTIGISDGSPGQTFACPHAPIHPRFAEERIVTRRRKLQDGEEEDHGAEGKDEDEPIERTWTEVHDFAASGPTDHHVVWDSASGQVRFGPAIRYADGTIAQHGAIPPKNAEIIVPAHRYGGGAVGNVGAGSLDSLRSSIAFIDRAVNLYPATGGVDAETIDEVKARAPISLRTGERCVTAEDFERETLDAAPTVARARCLPPAEPGGPVRLLVVPRVDKPSHELLLDDFALGDELVARVARHLEPRRILGTSVEIGTPYYQGVTITVLLSVLAGRPAEVVHKRVLRALYRFIDPVAGGRAGTGWEFDTDLLASDVFQLIGAVDGVDRVDEVLFFEADARNQQRFGNGREVIRLSSESLFLSFKHRVVIR
jgi:predicted phage baseplate assembly protein